MLGGFLRKAEPRTRKNFQSSMRQGADELKCVFVTRDRVEIPPYDSRAGRYPSKIGNALASIPSECERLGAKDAVAAVGVGEKKLLSAVKTPSLVEITALDGHRDQSRTPVGGNARKRQGAPFQGSSDR